MARARALDPTCFTRASPAGRLGFSLAAARASARSQFALTEASLVLATLAQAFSLRMVPGHPVVPEALMTLRPKYGLPMVLLPHKSHA
jgi:hypothetical protein